MYVPSPLGELQVTSNGQAVTGIALPPPAGWPRAAGKKGDCPPKKKGLSPFFLSPFFPAAPGEEDTVLRSAREQLLAYFAGELLDFDLPLAAVGTAFQKVVWEALRGIPYGRTASYEDIARRIGRPAACRAVGAANGRNPIAIVVPCHRVIGKDGTLIGYGGGLDRKQWLLRHEAGVLTGVTSARPLAAALF
jgi:methylated-DNA-[protein]-cysteine S-methyltransferase